MKAFFRSRNFIVFVTAVLVLSGVLVYSSRTGGGVISVICGVVLTPMQKITAAAAGSAQDSLAQAGTSYEALQAENERLQQQVNELNQQLAEFYTYQQENAQLKNYLGLKAENPDYQFVSASVVSRSTANPLFTLTLDQGSLAGVKVNDPVITDAGVVGWVSSVSAMYCTVTTLFSPDTSISATDKVNRENGTLGSTVQLAEQGLVKLGLLEAGTTVQADDLIVTSGIGGRFPKNLLIGKAIEIKAEEGDVSRYATVKPFADISQARDMIIITSFHGQGEISEQIAGG